MLTRLPNLTIDVGAGGPDDEIALTQEFGGTESMVTLHRSQLRLVAEKAGLLTPSAYRDPDNIIARLARQVRILYDRIDRLDDYISEKSQRGNEDLEDECALSFATWELANEFVKDLPEPDGEPNGKPMANAIGNPPSAAQAALDLGLEGATQ